MAIFHLDFKIVQEEGATFCCEKRLPPAHRITDDRIDRFRFCLQNRPMVILTIRVLCSFIIGFHQHAGYGNNADKTARQCA